MDGMSLFLTILYLTTILLGLGTFVLAVRLSRRHPVDFLKIFLNFLIAFTLSGFLNLIGRFIALSLLKASTPESQMIVNLAFGFMTFPFMLAALYFFILLMGAVGEAKVSRAARTGYLILTGVLILVLIIVTKVFLETRRMSPGAEIMGAINTGVIAAYIALSFWCLGMTSRIRDDGRRRLGRTVALAYAAAFTVGLVFPWNWLHRQVPEIRPLPMVLLYFSANVVPLLAFRRAFGRATAADAPEPAGGEDFAAFAGAGLSPRELEIVGLILQGKSNKDIEQELFISIHTVKNHIYNIYHKLGVRNRLQIVARAREAEARRRNGRPPDDSRS